MKRVKINKKDLDHLDKVMCTHLYDLECSNDEVGFKCPNCKEKLYMLNKQQIEFYGFNFDRKLKGKKYEAC